MFKRLIPILLVALPTFAQLTDQEKTSDFYQLAGLYAKDYAPFGWKLDLFNYNLYDVQPWLDQVHQTTDDIGFYDVLVRYVAALKDSHDELILPTDFYAYLGFRVDIYDGAVVIESIDRSLLPATKFKFQIGDELVSVDGTAVADLIAAQLPYAANGNGSESSRKRLAADAITLRYQTFFPQAPRVGNSSAIVVKRQNGTMETDSVPWFKSGTPLTGAGLVPGAFSTPLKSATVASPAPSLVRRREVRVRGASGNAWGVWEGPPMTPEAEPVPDYMQALKQLDTFQAFEPPVQAADAPGFFGGFGSPFPVFGPPPGFKERLGALQTDQFLSGTLPVGKLNVGFIRIPTMSPASTALALSQFQAEIAYFNQNTDALVIDVMRNGGGSGCYAEGLMQYLVPHPFRGVAAEIRATNNWVESFSSALTAAEDEGAPRWVIQLYTLYIDVLQQTVASNRGSTGSLPMCDPSFDGVAPAKDTKGNILAYTKPILVLTDDFTLSAAELFAMMLQDEGRATMFGTRTDGGGGNVFAYNGTDYSEATTRVTESLLTRAREVQTPGYPASHYIENVGVYPDIAGDYMTKDNLLNGGKTFVSAFSAAVAKLAAQ